MAIEDQSITAVQVDRALPIENTPYPSNPTGRRRFTVKIGNETTEAVPVVITSGSPGTPVFMDSPTNSTNPGSYVTLIDVVVPVGKTRQLNTLLLTCRVEGTFQVLSDTDVILSGRTGPASPTFSFAWNPSRPISAGTEIKVQFKAVAGTPIRDVEAYLSATDS